MPEQGNAGNGTGEEQEPYRVRFNARFDIFLSSEQKEKAIELAQVRGVSVSQLIRDSLQHELDRYAESKLRLIGPTERKAQLTR